MSEWGDLIASGLAGGTLGSVVTAVSSVFRSRGKNQKKVDVAKVERDGTVVGPLLGRITTLEKRCDALSKEAEDCREGRAECERRTEGLAARIEEAEARAEESEELVEKMQSLVERVSMRLDSVPPPPPRSPE